ncbi:Hypothetical protein A7982_00457 [Minicystis rosea]|nr:Hypothetical protein A7982_00457 [Minicystis rosea]
MTSRRCVGTSASMRGRVFTFALLGVAGCTQDLPPPPAPCPEAPAAVTSPPKTVAPPAAPEGVVTKVEARDQVPLSGPRVDAKVGDWMIANGDRVAIVSAEGRFVDFGAKGGRDELVALDPMVFFGFEGVHFETEKVEPVSEGRAIHVVKRVLEKPLALHVFVTFSGSGCASSRRSWRRARSRAQSR